MVEAMYNAAVCPFRDGGGLKSVVVKSMNAMEIRKCFVSVLDMFCWL